VVWVDPDFLQDVSEVVVVFYFNLLDTLALCGSDFDELVFLKAEKQQLHLFKRMYVNM